MRPTLCSPITFETLLRLAEDDRWSLTQKIDGHRRLVVIEDGHVAGYSRKGERTDVPQRISTALSSRLPEGRFVLDGELLGGQFIVFDLVEAGDLVSSETPYSDRLTALRALSEMTKWVKQTEATRRRPMTLLPVAQTTIEKLTLIKRVEEERCEGVVARLASGTYQEGKPSRDVVKWKRVKDIDCVVVDRDRGGKANFILGLYDNEEMVEVGAVSALTGDGPRITLGDVIEVSYLYCSEDGQLVQPVSPRLRSSKDARECTTEQLQYTNKEVLL